MLNNLFSFFLARNVYVRVRRNQFQIRNLESGFEATVIARAPFTTTRLLIGQFVVAQNTLKEALKQESKDRLFAVSPYIVIHPLEMVEGGLSEIEERIFREVAVGAGASKVVVWFGHELNDAEVKEKLSGS
jgi:hypothetical protein